MTRLFRQGDIVSVNFVVSRDQEPQHSLVPAYPAEWDSRPLFYFKPGDLTLVAPKIEVGNRVRCRLQAGVVLAVDGPFVWVKRDDGDYVGSRYTTWLARECEVLSTTETSDLMGTVVVLEEEEG